MNRTSAGRPIVNGVKAPLTGASPEAWWEEEAIRLGLSVQDLKEQVRLADEMIGEVIAEEAAGHSWTFKEKGPKGDPKWGDWWKCSRCGEGCRYEGQPPVDKLVLDGMFTCEEMQQQVRHTPELSCLEDDDEYGVEDEEDQ